MKDNVYVFRTHFWNSRMSDMVRQMREQLGGDRIYVMYDITTVAGGEAAARAAVESTADSHLGVHRRTAGDRLGGATARVVLLDEDDCAALNPLHKVGRHTGSVFRPEAQVLVMAD